MSSKRFYCSEISEVAKMISISQGSGDGGAPKPNKASKKGKKSWRKNVDMKVGYTLRPL